MNRFNSFLAATFLSAAMLFTSVAQAMEIRQFDKMAQQDRAEYAMQLVQGAERVLRNDGKPDLAAQVRNLFATNAPDGNISIGMSQFMLDLANARVVDAQDPKADRLEVEDAMYVTLKRNHIVMPPTFFTVASNFKAKFPPRKN